MLIGVLAGEIARPATSEDETGKGDELLDEDATDHVQRAFERDWRLGLALVAEALHDESEGGRIRA